jgi:DNA polymerase epsilon subunit 1
MSIIQNLDFFDWPFVETRAKLHGMDMDNIIGFSKNREDIYQSVGCCIHMDAFAWVKRDR